MSAFVVGNIVGRLFASYLVALLILLIASKFKPKLALRRSVRWYGLLMTTVIFLVGLGGFLVRQGSIA